MYESIKKQLLKESNKFLQKKNMTQYRLQMNSGLPRGTFLSLMYARYKGVNLTTLIGVIRTLGLSVEEFFASELFDNENLELD